MSNSGTTVWFSLRRRLLGLLLGGVAAAWLVTMVFSYIDAHHEVDELFDAQLAQAGQTLLALAGHDEGDDISDLGDAAHKYQRRLRCQIWRADGKLLMRSNNAPQTPLTTATGFSETRGEEGHWRHFSQWNDDRSLQVQVSENHHIRDDLIGHIAWRLLFPALFGLPLIGLWVWLATRHGFASLDGIARQIASRDPQQLQPLHPAAAPEEIRTLLESLNGLFQRVEHTLEAERRFTADAAHELRTPLAALQAQLQVALRARDDDERNRSLNQLQSGLTRASHLVDQMLQLARLDPESGLPDPQAVDLAALAEAVCADLGPQILARNLDFDLEADPNTVVTGQAEWLRVLIRNLVDNAVRYTPAGGQVRVLIRRHGSTINLSVSDSGPGIPVEERESVLRRFHRLNQGIQPGSGLGLAIVARIAELHGTTLCLDSSPITKGLDVGVQFAARCTTA
ncbi:ATP-binding protein [Ferribacterium limneticum]|uniref:ATP-binding protein n=1 Tax=Ferribacterium limneticum TaxID=76259 RepID=UPI001CFA613C|nr:ATP-binding protein [Ferribacterium limneticum]UCV29848.1 sensor histidine kinase N-terminal domain-containing protein [Ferribacterium limneticum]UCV33767.1 sensor histidine kinase N-terminal domain-containing protein [Ferribacterium limneticum]